ncbi:MAG: DNA repair protein RecO [Gammaproteobacteria bacterium]|nr:MAG: DNA repair protein RecO [Gammaproteobacteria bacterium]
MSLIERVDLASAFVLHARRWRETSELLDVITCEHGRVSLLARGLRRPRSGLRAILQAFQPLSLSWSGRAGGLMTLRAAEPDGPAAPLRGKSLMAGFYLNELLLRFLQRSDPHPRLFEAYARTLGALADGTAPEAGLRRFELLLLAETGYGLNLDHDASSGERLRPGGSYVYVLERGPVPASVGMPAGLEFSGAELLAIGQGVFPDLPSLSAARRLLRAVLDHHLDGQPLRTREVYVAMRR